MASYEIRIAHLTELHSVLESQLTQSLIIGHPEDVIADLKKRKLQIKDQMRELIKKDSEGREAV